MATYRRCGRALPPVVVRGITMAAFWVVLMAPLAGQQPGATPSE